MLNQFEAQVFLALEQENEKQKQRVTKAHQISIFSLLLATGALAIISRSPNTTSLPDCFKDQSLVIQAVPAVISTRNNKSIYVFICPSRTKTVFQQQLSSLQKCIQVSVTLFAFASMIRVIYIFDPGGRIPHSNTTSSIHHNIQQPTMLPSEQHQQPTSPVFHDKAFTTHLSFHLHFSPTIQHQSHTLSCIRPL